MSLAKTLEEIKKVKPYAEENVDDGPRETLPGRRGRKSQAIESLKRLRREYRQDLMDSAVYIIVTGDKAEAFASTAKEEVKVFSANANEFYEDLVGRIPPTLYMGKESVSYLFDTIGRHLEDKAAELDIIGYPQLIFKQEYRVTIKDKKDLVDLVRTAINDQVGPEIVGINTLQNLIDPAIKAEHKGNNTPILITANTEKLAMDLYNSLGRLRPKGTFLVVAGKGTKALKAVEDSVSVKEPSKETVEQALKSIISKLKK